MKTQRAHLAFVRNVLIAISISFAGWAQAGVVVVVGAKSPVNNLSVQQVSDIFLGKSKRLTPLDQLDSSKLRNEFYFKVSGNSAAQAKFDWAKLFFTGKGIPPKECKSSAEIKQLVSENLELVGYIESSAVDSSVKVVFSTE